MIELKTKAKKWGNSVGIILPKKLGIRAEQELTIHVEPPRGFTKAKDIFGTMKFNKSTENIMREIDRDLDSEF